MKNRPKKARRASVFGALLRLANSRGWDTLFGGKQEVFLRPSLKKLRVKSASPLIGRGPSSRRVSGERHCGRKKQRLNKPLFILSFRGCAPPSSHEGVGCVRCILVDKSLLLCYNSIALVGRKPKVGSLSGPTERSSYNAEMGPLEGCRGCEASHLTVPFLRAVIFYAFGRRRGGSFRRILPKGITDRGF